MMPRSIALALLLALGCADGRSASGSSLARVTDPRDLGKCVDRTISSQGVGAIRIGMTAGALRGICNVVHDSIEVHGPEGYEGRVMVVLVGEDTVQAFIDDSTHVTGIEVAQRGFATADSLMIGTTLGRLLRLPGATLANEGGFDVARIPSLCGVAFEIGWNYTDYPVATIDSSSAESPPPWRPVIIIKVEGCG
jgi:hypothetical protein